MPLSREENQREYDARVELVREGEAAGTDVAPGVYAALLVLARRLGDEPAAEVWAEEMRRAMDRAARRRLHRPDGR